MKIVLIGFMGAGKTTVSKLLASRLGYEHCELDDVALRLSGRNSISEIFDADGETTFRELEQAAAAEISANHDLVVSTGGGVVSHKPTMTTLTAMGETVVHLDVTFETVCQRLSGDTERPLFRNREKAEELYRARKPLYEQYATFQIATDDFAPDEIASEIVKRLA